MLGEDAIVGWRRRGYRRRRLLLLSSTFPSSLPRVEIGRIWIAKKEREGAADKVPILNRFNNFVFPALFPISFFGFFKGNFSRLEVFRHRATSIN